MSTRQERQEQIALLAKEMIDSKPVFIAPKVLPRKKVIAEEIIDGAVIVNDLDEDVGDDSESDDSNDGAEGSDEGKKEIEETVSSRVDYSRTARGANDAVDTFATSRKIPISHQVLYINSIYFYFIIFLD